MISFCQENLEWVNKVTYSRGLAPLQYPLRNRTYSRPLVNKTRHPSTNGPRIPPIKNQPSSQLNPTSAFGLGRLYLDQPLAHSIFSDKSLGMLISSTPSTRFVTDSSSRDIAERFLHASRDGSVKNTAKRPSCLMMGWLLRRKMFDQC